jgi:hypothetical protein
MQDCLPPWVRRGVGIRSQADAVELAGYQRAQRVGEPVLVVRGVSFEGAEQVVGEDDVVFLAVQQDGIGPVAAQDPIPRPHPRAEGFPPTLGLTSIRATGR